jgi:hypothetical protein
LEDEVIKMAEPTLEEMLKIVRDTYKHREETYKRVNGAPGSEKGWYTNDDLGHDRFLEDLKENPAVPVKVATPAPAAPAPAAPTPPAPTPAPTTPTPPAPTPAPAVPEAYVGYSDASYASLSAKHRQTRIANLVLPHYLNRQSSNSWLAKGAIGLAASLALLIGNCATPKISVDEANAKYEIQRQRVEVSDYVKRRGQEPSWKRSDEQILLDNTSNNATKKDVLFYAGLLALALGLGGLGYGAKKRS